MRSLGKQWVRVIYTTTDYDTNQTVTTGDVIERRVVYRDGQGRFLCNYLTGKRYVEAVECESHAFVWHISNTLHRCGTPLSDFPMFNNPFSS